MDVWQLKYTSEKMTDTFPWPLPVFGSKGRNSTHTYYSTFFYTKVFHPKEVHVTNGKFKHESQTIKITFKSEHTHTHSHKTTRIKTFALPKCKLDEDPCDGRDGGGVSECPGVWLGRGMPIGLGEDEKPRLL